MSAPKSRIPDVVRALGWLFLVAGLLMPIIGFEFLSSAIDSFVSVGRWGARVWGAIALALGLFVTYMVAPTFRAA